MLEIDALLRTGLFDDVVYTGVRFRHREIRELLGAEWANDLLQQLGKRAQIEHLFFRDSYGEKIIVPRTRPILTWLILLDAVVGQNAGTRTRNCKRGRRPFPFTTGVTSIHAP